VEWPAGQSAYDQRRATPEPLGWSGSVFENQRDGSGLEYRRNRYYDPKVGRFTQEDPIGLAGGLNLYGFANGDPVNFSDPFGLTPEDCRRVKCPTIGAIQGNPALRARGEALLALSEADKRERGAYLFNGPNGTIRVGTIYIGRPNSDRIENWGDAPPDAIGMIHTHPRIRGTGGWEAGGGDPSSDDAQLVRQNYIHGVVEEKQKRYFQPYDRNGNFYTVEREPPTEP
jgi:RHS repeat-associated protein